MNTDHIFNISIRGDAGVIQGRNQGDDLPHYLMRHWTVIALLLLLVVTASCTVSPPPNASPELGFAIPNGWRTATLEGQPSERWWDDFQDHTLAALIKEALEANQNLQAAASRVAIAQAEARVAGAVLAPVVDGLFDGQRQRINQPMENTASSFSLGLRFQWEIDLWGRLRASVRSGVANYQAEEEAYRAAALSLTVQVAKTWYAVTEARLQVRLAEETVESFQATHRQAASRVRAGVQSPVDQPLADANLASAEAGLASRKEILARSCRQLEIILGRYPGGKIEGADDLPIVTTPAPAGLPSQIIRRRPDVRQLERQLASALARVDVAQGSLYPQLTLTGNLGSSSPDLDDLLSGGTSVWSIAGGLVQPLFQGGRLRAQVDAADGRAQGAARLFAQGVLDALFEVEAALVAESLLRVQERSLARASVSAQRAVTISKNRYEQGVEQVIVLLESQRRALDVQSNHLTVRRALLDNRLDLHLALGGGFDALPTPDKDPNAVHQQNGQ